MGYQLRDQQGASRAVAYLMMAGAPFEFLTGVVLDPHQPVATLIGITLTSVTLGLGGAACRWLPERVPKCFWSMVPFFSILVIGGLNLVTRDATTGAQLFYLWPVLYTANFLSRRTICLTLITVSAAEAVVVFPGLVLGNAFSDWISLTVSLTLTALIVSSLRSRNDRLREVLEAQAFADALTGVANRRSFDAGLNRAVAWARGSGEPIALLTLDVDHFKKINDTWGHAVGDRALQLVAATLESAARGDGELVARLGGDEFVVLLRTDGVGARRAADEIRTRLATADGLPGGPPILSIGVAVLPDHASFGEELIAASDAALYAAKSGGRGRTAVAPPPPPRHNVEQVAQDTGVS